MAPGRRHQGAPHPLHLVALLLLIGLARAELPSLEDAEVYIEKAASSLWTPEVGGKAVVGAGAGALLGLLAKQMSDVINAILVSCAGLIAFRIFTETRPETFGAQTVQETFGELHRLATSHLDRNGDGKLDGRDAQSVISRVAPFFKRQGPFVVGFAIGLSLTSGLSA